MSALKSLISVSIRDKYRELRARVLSIGLDRDSNHVMSLKERIASASISVIVPIHDAPEVVERCVHSLERNGGDAEIILIDDGSRLERTREIIAQAVVRNGWATARWETAGGHSRACERGAMMAQRTHLCFLNSDTVVTPFSWAGMLNALLSDQSIGVVGPSTSRTSTSQAITRAELCSPFWTDRQIDEFAFRYTTRFEKDAGIDMEYVGGFAFIVTRSAWSESKGFDPQLPAYGNEVDLCRRLKKRGYRILWTRASYIHHFEESSFLQHFTSEELHQQRVVTSRYINNKVE